MARPALGNGAMQGDNAERPRVLLTVHAVAVTNGPGILIPCISSSCLAPAVGNSDEPHCSPSSQEGQERDANTEVRFA